MSKICFRRHRFPQNLHTHTHRANIRSEREREMERKALKRQTTSAHRWLLFSSSYTIYIVASRRRIVILYISRVYKSKSRNYHEICLAHSVLYLILSLTAVRVRAPKTLNTTTEWKLSKWRTQTEPAIWKWQWKIFGRILSIYDHLVHFI